VWAGNAPTLYATAYAVCRKGEQRRRISARSSPKNRPQAANEALAPVGTPVANQVLQPGKKQKAGFDIAGA
jgi:hypothetical protein